MGDERFQRKCIERVKVFQREGRTILLVTHSPDQVRSICDRAVVLSHGDVMHEGPPGEAVRIFREGLLEEEGTLAIPDESPEPHAADDRAQGHTGCRSSGAGDLRRPHATPGSKRSAIWPPVTP